MFKFVSKSSKRGESMIRNLVIGNGINIQHGGFDFSNTAIILRTLKCFKDPNFPKHILTDDPIEAKCYIGYLFLEIPRILSGDYDALANCSAERSSLYEFKTKYSNKASLKITDIGFEDYYLIHDLLCHRIKMGNPERYIVRESVIWCFLNAIYDNGNVNSLSDKYSEGFIRWMNAFDNIFTTNYDVNIEKATGRSVLHLHGDFVTRKSIYNPDSFRNQLSDHPIKKCVIDENYAHLYSTALSTHCGDYKRYSMDEGELANTAVEKMAIAYESNPLVRADVDSWENDRNELVARLRESILFKVENSTLKFDEAYPIRKITDMNGELIILGLSPYNDRHLFDIINKSNISKCSFYFYDESECDVIKGLLSNKVVDFEDVKKFWGVSKSDSKKTSSKKRIVFKDVSRSDFNKFADCYRELSKSIMNDNAIVRQFNRTPYDIRAKVCNQIKEMKVERDREISQQFVLNIVDIHIIAAEFNLDPAVVCCIGVDNCKNEFIRLR